MLEGDCLVVAVDARNDASQGYREDDSELGFAYAPAGALTWRWFPTDRTGPVYSAKVAVVREAKPRALEAGVPPIKLTYEISIPWFELPDTGATGAPAAPGALGRQPPDTFGFDLALNDVDAGRRHGWLQWSAGMMGIKDPSRFGNVHLVGPAPPEQVKPPKQGATGAPVNAGEAGGAMASLTGISYDRRGFIIDGRPALLFGGTFDYLRCAKDEWRDRLLKMKAAGLNCVSTHIPWNWHERQMGEVNLAELDDFLSLAEGLGLYVIAQPGPYIGDGWTGGGFPPWLAGKRLEYRSANPDFLAWCKHWFGEVMPVIARHQISKGGGVVLVQLENSLGDPPGAGDLVKALRAMARGSGIAVPLVTLDTGSARDNGDAAMADVIDGTELRIGGDVSSNQRALSGLSVRENDAPLLVTLRTAGGNEGAPGLPAASEIEPGQVSALTALALEAGADLLDYHAACAGTTFGYWAAAGSPTGHDLGAPIAEPGGLTASYYVVKDFGDFLSAFGPMLAHSWMLPASAAFADDSGVSVAERISGETAFIFLRDQGDASLAREAHHLRVTYTDPLDGRQVTVPSVGQIMLGAGGSRILIAGVALDHGRLDYCTSEVTALETVADRQVLLLHGEPGEAGELRLRLDAQPAIAGDAVGSTWDPARRTLTLSYRVRDTEQHVLVDTLELVIAATARAQRSWAVRADDDTLRMISDAYFLRDARADPAGITMTFDLRPGPSAFTAVLPRAPSSVTVDDKPAPFAYDPVTRVIAFSTSTAAPEERHPRRGVLDKIKDLFTGGGPSLRQSFDRGRVITEPLVGEQGWRPVELKPLQELDVVSAGYAFYHATFDAAGAGSISVETYAPDPKLVYVNQRLVLDLSAPATRCTADVSGILQPGENTIDVMYYNPGWPDSGPGLAEPKGLRAVDLLGPGGSSAEPAPEVRAPASGESDGAKPAGASSEAVPAERAVAVQGWQLRSQLFGEVAGWALPEYNDGAWSAIGLGDWKRESWALRQFDGIAWYRIPFTLPQREGWDIPWKLRLDAAEETLIYLNGQLLGKHHAGASQSDFFLPRAWLRPGGRNLLAFAVRSGQSGSGLKAMSIEPYDSFVVRPTRITIAY